MISDAMICIKSVIDFKLPQIIMRALFGQLFNQPRTFLPHALSVNCSTAH
jgi:hypothetical protein